MLKNEVWKDVLTRLNLLETENQRERLFLERYDKWERKSGKRYGKLYDETRSPDCHTYVCYECMEKALGRKLERGDMIGENVFLNREFEKEYFK